MPGLPRDLLDLILQLHEINNDKDRYTDNFRHSDLVVGLIPDDASYYSGSALDTLFWTVCASSLTLESQSTLGLKADEEESDEIEERNIIVHGTEEVGSFKKYFGEQKRENGFFPCRIIVTWGGSTESEGVCGSTRFYLLPGIVPGYSFYMLCGRYEER